MNTNRSLPEKFPGLLGLDVCSGTKNTEYSLAHISIVNWSDVAETEEFSKPEFTLYAGNAGISDSGVFPVFLGE